MWKKRIPYFAGLSIQKLFKELLVLFFFFLQSCSFTANTSRFLSAGLTSACLTRFTCSKLNEQKWQLNLNFYMMDKHEIDLM